MALRLGQRKQLLEQDVTGAECDGGFHGLVQGRVGALEIDPMLLGQAPEALAHDGEARGAPAQQPVEELEHARVAADRAQDGLELGVRTRVQGGETPHQLAGLSA